MQKADAFFRKLVSDSKNGGGAAICSVCSSNELVLEAALEEGARTGGFVLIEATANQVNQYGGYTGMTPGEYCLWVSELAAKTGFGQERLILGGDHLGPLTWSKLCSDEAMDKAECLVREYAKSGFQKLHIDCSMLLGDDQPGVPLPVELAAQRTARLVKAAEESSPLTPVYVIGSEVPIPGGAVREEKAPDVTTPDALRREYEVFRREFESRGMEDAWTRVIAIVSQPGVEFGDNQVFIYDREKASLLAAASRMLPVVLEGHSTDYQPAKALQNMKNDGIAILKVGPALTFSLRRAIFSLEEMERIIYRQAPERGYSCFADTLEREMLADPSNWEKHYRGDADTVALMRKYSLSDRCRYYLERPAVRDAMLRLFSNIDDAAIPYGLMYQYFPEQAEKIISGELGASAREIVKEQICHVLRSYG